MGTKTNKDESYREISDPNFLRILLQQYHTSFSDVVTSLPFVLLHKEKRQNPQILYSFFTGCSLTLNWLQSNTLLLLYSIISDYIKYFAVICDTKYA